MARAPKVFRYKQDAKSRVWIAFVFLVIVCVLLVGIYYYQENHMNYTAINKIKSVQTGPNKFFDLSNEIEVSSVNDVNYNILNNGNFEIHYGKQVIVIPKKYIDNKDPELFSRLKEIGLEIKQKRRINPDTGKEEILYKVLYWGDPIRLVVQRG